MEKEKIREKLREAVPAPLKGDCLKGRQPEARGFSRVRLHKMGKYCAFRGIPLMLLPDE